MGKVRLRGGSLMVHIIAGQGLGACIYRISLETFWTDRPAGPRA